IYVIPVMLREVRPKDIDDACMELGAELIRADDAYPGAREQEQALLHDVAQRTDADLDLVRKAIEVIKVYHGPVKRKSGEPFYLHPIAVAQIVLDYNQDEATVLAALLHDTVEDTPMLLENIETMFNKDVACIVDGVTHLESNKDSFHKVKLSAHENIMMLLEVAEKRALYVKIADRMHNMRTIKAKSPKSQRKNAEETLLFYVPLAERLGLDQAAKEFKELCFDILSKK
ncbi:MAG: HD domain-containing protein, partial [Bacteroidota bacterium]